jgi:hypothetical protein
VLLVLYHPAKSSVQAINTSGALHDYVGADSKFSTKTSLVIYTERYANYGHLRYGEQMVDYDLATSYLSRGWPRHIPADLQTRSVTLLFLLRYG